LFKYELSSDLFLSRSATIKTDPELNL